MFFGRLKRWLENVRLKSWYARHERSLVSIFLVAGFLLHFFTFRTLEVGITLIGLGVYLIIAAASMVYVFAFDARGDAWKHPWLQRLRLITPLLTQLAFGSLLSMALLFYWFSGSFLPSWPVFVLLILLIIFNESFRHAYLRPVVQVALFTFVLFSYCSLLFPFIFNSLAMWVTVLGWGSCLAASFFFVWLLARVTPALKTRVKHMIVAVCLVFLAMNLFYFLNLIPPVPLSLREAGIYHSVQRVGDQYRLVGEPEPWWERLLPGRTIHQDPTGKVYAYTAVYSPADLNTKIFHVWQYYNIPEKKWITIDRLSFSITGGRGDGYRGFTFKSRLVPGDWRVSIETERGQVLGRIPFTYVTN